MKHLLLPIILIFSSLQLSAQLEIINQEDGLVIESYNEFSISYMLDIKNNSDTTVTFDWEMYIPEEVRENIYYSLHDLNIGWVPSIYSSCGYNQPNMLDSMETGTMSVEFRILEQIPDDNLHLIDSIALRLLTHPDCEAFYTEINGAQMVPTSNSHLSENPIEFYPNPNFGVLYCKNINGENISYDILSFDGKLLQSGVIDKDQITLAPEINGLIFLNYLHNGGYYFQKILVNQD